MKPSPLLAFILFAIVIPHQPARAEQPVLRGGSYEIIARLELPHLERWAVDRTATICLPDTGTGSEIPIPVLSANNPFAACKPARGV